MNSALRLDLIAALFPVALLGGLLPACKGDDSKTPALDSDGDGVADDVDCAPNDPDTYQGATEICDNVDNDCNGQADEGLTVAWYPDIDGDGYGNNAGVLARCAQPDGYITDNTDCDDSSDSSFPGGTEVCDGHDNDCNGTKDDGVGQVWNLDEDGDGWGGDKTIFVCEPDVAVGPVGDCDDSDRNSHPGVFDTCGDGIDQDCNDRDDICQTAIDDISTAVFNGEIKNEYAGYTLAGVPDVTGDGEPDLVLGVIGANKFSGTVYVWSGIPAAGDHLASDGLFELQGQGKGVGTGGGGLAPGGDLTGDGIDDLVVGGQDFNGAAALVQIVAGPITGSMILDDGASSVVTVLGSYAVVTGTALGDVNGDGHDDLAVGQPYGSDYGVVSIMHGPLAGDDDIGNYDTVSISGDAKGDTLGWTTKPAGDVDGDGMNDVLVGTAGAAGVFILPGDASSDATAGDVALSIWHPDPKLNYALGQGVASVGDADGDGYGDFAMADNYWNSGDGIVYIARGPASGDHGIDEATATIIPSESAGGMGAQMDSGDMDGDGVIDVLAQEWTGWSGNGGSVAVISGDSEGTTYTGEHAYFYTDLPANESNFGAIGAVPDMDGDGRSEMLFGSASSPSDTSMGRITFTLGADMFP